MIPKVLSLPLVEDVLLEAAAMQEEIFGPMLPVFVFRTGWGSD
jgi:acyl-CoA reductase-like NAD-dependent aldehyde dehydrogenase